MEELNEEDMKREGGACGGGGFYTRQNVQGNTGRLILPKRERC